MPKTSTALCPASGTNSGRFGGGTDQCPACGRMVYIAETGRVAKHRLSAKAARAIIQGPGRAAIGQPIDSQRNR